MKSKTIVLFAFAGICGLVAMLGVRKALSKKEPEVPMVSVLVAMADLQASNHLNETNSEFKAVPADSVPEDAITDRKQYMDRALKVRVLPGDWITTSKLGEAGETGISVQIPMGMRVVSVSVNQTTSHSGMLTAGNRVDVMLTYNARTETGTIQQTRTVLQYIEIFAVDKQIDGAKANIAEQSARNVSVLATPDQARLLLLAQKKGDIHLALRSNKDTEQDAGDTISVAELEGHDGTFGARSKRDLLTEQNGGDEDAAPDSVNQQLLNAANGGSVASATTVVAEAPEANVWEMQIYSGGESTTEEVIDDNPVAQAQPAAGENNGEGKSFWRGLIGTYFRGM